MIDPNLRASTASGAAAGGEGGVSPASLTLLIASAGTFLVLVAFTSTVTTVGPTARALHAGPGGRTWILSSISLGLAVALLALGELADSRGRQRIFVWSTGALALTSVATGLAPSLEVLVGARIVEGIACAGVLACGLGLIGHAFPAGRARTRATGLWGGDGRRWNRRRPRSERGAGCRRQLAHDPLGDRRPRATAHTTRSADDGEST